MIPLPCDCRGIYDTSSIDWGNDFFCLKFRQLNIDMGFHGKWNIPRATKKQILR